MGTNSLTRERKGNEEEEHNFKTSICKYLLHRWISCRYVFTSMAFHRFLFTFIVSNMYAAAGASILGGGERMTANTRLLHSRTHVP